MRTVTQGGSFLATLGFEIESRWDSWVARLVRTKIEMRPLRRAQPNPTNNDGRANLPVCPNLTASKRSNAGGSLGGAATPPYRGGVQLGPGRNQFFSISR